YKSQPAEVPSSTLDITPPSFDPGPIAPDVDLTDPTVSRSRPGPRVNVVRPPMDFSPDTATDSSPDTGGQKPNFPVLNKFKDALGSAVGAVTDAVGKAINPGASGKPSGAGDSRASTP
ncbi:MAG: hypothetical protein KIH64_004495, partial [Mycobacterium sp.]|nr:hypothetical protein [Mycobacterium sp.]